MGLVMTTVLLRNARVPTLAIQVEALADTGSVHLCIPQGVCDRLRLEKTAEKEVLLADGSTRIVPYVGPVEIRFENRAAFVGAVVVGDHVRIGTIPMEDMDLVVIPGTRRLQARARGAGEPPGRYALPQASPGPGSSLSEGWPSERSPSRSLASPPP